TAPRRRPIGGAGARAFSTTAGWALAGLLLLPPLTLVLISLVPYGSWTTEALPPVLSGINYQRLFAEPERLRPLVNSLWMAAGSTAGALALALAAASLGGRGRQCKRRSWPGHAHPGCGAPSRDSSPCHGRSPAPSSRSRSSRRSVSTARQRCAGFSPGPRCCCRSRTWCGTFL